MKDDNRMWLLVFLITLGGVALMIACPLAIEHLRECKP